MRVSEKLDLISKVGRELQSRYTFDEIDAFLREFRLQLPEEGAWSSKWVYSKAALSGVDDATLTRIAVELGLAEAGGAAGPLVASNHWSHTTEFRLFISHLARERAKATRLKECLSPYAISAFVAHEDITPTSEWQTEIEAALRCMDAFIAIHTNGFSESIWCQQEVGYALGRGVKLISLRMGEDPKGFIGKQQALARRERTAEEIALEVESILRADPRTCSRLEQAQSAQ